MTATLIKMDSKNLDDIRLVIDGDVTQIIKLKDKFSACELCRVLTCVYFEVNSNYNKEVTIEIDGIKYTFPVNVWHQALTVMNEWLGFYILDEFPDDVPEEES